MKIKEKIFLNLGLIMAVVLSLIFFAILPLADQVKANNKEIKAQKQSAKLVDLEIKAQKLEQEFNLLKKKLFNPERAIELVQALEQIALATNNELSLNILNFDSLFLQISLNSGITNLLNFLEKLESTDYLISAESLNMNFDINKQTWQSNLKIRIYTEDDIQKTIDKEEEEKKKQKKL